jgi:hypothetical protein
LSCLRFLFLRVRRIGDDEQYFTRYFRQ